MAAGKSNKTRRVTRRKLPPRAAKKKKSVVEETTTERNPNSRVCSKTKIADLSEERQIVVRKQNQIATAKKRAKGGEVLKIAENQKAVDRYVMKVVIVSIGEMIWHSSILCLH